MKKVRVDVISDTVCPWCYIGKRRLEKAIAGKSEELQVEVVFHPFQLDPSIPKEGRDADAHYAAKFGDLSRFEQMREHVAAVGREEGIAFDWKAQKRAPNTFDSHRLALYAADYGKQLEVIEALFAAHFEKGLDVGSEDTLVSIATEAGLDAEQTRAFLRSDAGRQEVEALEAQARRLGVSGVPFFIVDGKWAVSGAQPPEVLSEIFEKARSEA